MRPFAVVASICLAVAPALARADEPRVPARAARNTISLELLGSGLLYTLNYERFVTDAVAVRIGAGYLETGDWLAFSSDEDVATRTLLVPLTVSVLPVTNGRHALEIGAGVTLRAEAETVERRFPEPARETSRDLEIWPGGLFGYRYAPVNGGINFRATLTPLVRGKEGLLPWFGVSLGYAF